MNRKSPDWCLTVITVVFLVLPFAWLWAAAR
jgi:hypothetical protein